MTGEEILDKIITEELEKQVEALNLSSPEKIGNVLQELFTFSTDNFLKNIGSQEAILDEKESLPEENWDWLMETINQSYQEVPEPWEEELGKQKLKILCFKYFTKQEFIELDEVEKSLKMNIKKYFTSLQNYADMEDFKNKFFNLPFEMLSNFTRYLLNNSKELNSKIKISKEDLKKRVKSLKDERNKVVNKISQISRKYQTTINLTELKELYDSGLFWEDNYLNRGVNEYISKLLNNTATQDKIKDAYNSAFFYDLKAQAEGCPSYQKHVESIKKDEDKEYFTSKGMQIGTRFDNIIEITKNKEGEKEGYSIDDKSRLKEPYSKIESTDYPWESNDGEPLSPDDEENMGADAAGGDMGGGGGGLAGGGGLSYSPPTLGPQQDAEGNEINPEDDAEATADDGTEMPTTDEGLPVDFGTPGTNPEGAENPPEEKK